MTLSRFRAVLFAAFAAVGAAAAGAAENSQQPQQEVKPQRIVNRVAATVNGRPITSSEVRNRLVPYIRELTMLYPQQGPRFNAELVKAKRAVMDELIERELVLSEFEARGYVMPESAVDEEINRRILTTFGGKRENLLEMLRQSGMTYSEYRDSVRKEITAAAMRTQLYEMEIPPTPDEIRAEYEATKYDYRDIQEDEISYDKIYISAVPSEEELYSMVGVPPTDPSFAEKYQQAYIFCANARYDEAVRLAEDIRSGKISFEEAARTHSCDIHAKDGGRWPAIKRKDLSVEFANIVFSAPEGKVVGPLYDPEGFTIVRVRSRKLAPPPSLDSPGIKDRVDDSVRRKQSEARYRRWVDRLRQNAVIRIYI